MNVTLHLYCLFGLFPAAEYHAGIRLLRTVFLCVNTTKSPLSTTLVGFNGGRFLSHSSVSFLLVHSKLLLEILALPLLEVQVLLVLIWVLKEENLCQRGLYCLLVPLAILMEKQEPP